MATWIIAYNQNGNTSMMKVNADQRPDLDKAVELVTKKAEREHSELDFALELGGEPSPALLLAERFGITVTGIAQC